MFVRSWMTPYAMIIPPLVPVGAAMAFMEKHKIRHLPIVADGKLEGIVTVGDLLAEVGRGPDRRGVDRTVSDVMTRQPVTASPDDTLERAAQIMLTRKLSGLPVVEDGERVVGIITESDIFRALGEILGISGSGARVVMTVGEDEDVLGAIAKRLDGLALQSLATYHNTALKRWEIVIRVRGTESGVSPVVKGVDHVRTRSDPS